ncbi:protein of unknown function [Paenibacillus alvei]|uniref:Uncharacterized protein n=1 Tax=Paenibacillus alvei TaxID=44250 RepID=A0A383RLR0_PAEAL|nr:protein of unknown function [Paenibacillus alvei]
MVKRFQALQREKYEIGTPIQMIKQTDLANFIVDVT